MIVLGIQQFQDPYYQGVAAQLAFFMFLSILPTLHTFVPGARILFPLSLSSIENWVDINISGAGADTLRRYAQLLILRECEQCVPGDSQRYGQPPECSLR